jgi:hypothetical protein
MSTPFLVLGWLADEAHCSMQRPQQLPGPSCCRDDVHAQYLRLRASGTAALGFVSNNVKQSVHTASSLVSKQNAQAGQWLPSSSCVTAFRSQQA